MNIRRLIAVAAVLCAAAADALPSAAYFRSRPAKPEIDSGVFARDAARDLGEVDRIVKGEIEVVGVTWAFPSNRVDWLFDASAKKGPYNAEWTWQLNRMSFWTALARAYTRTGDEKYALEMEIGGDGGEQAEAVTGRLKPSMAGWFVGREYLVPMVRPATTVFVKAPKGKAHRFNTVLRPVCSSANSCLISSR